MLKKVFPFILLVLVVACQSQNKEDVTAKQVTSSDFFDLDDIQKSGEIIVLTLYGPTTYYENHGYEGGIQYQIAQAFAQDIGARVRIEIASDEKELKEQLNAGEADVIAYNLPYDVKEKRLIWCGDSLETRKSSWAVRNNSPLLAEEISKWFEKNTQKVNDIWTARERRQKLQNRQARIQRKALMKDPTRGIISDYDGLFKRNSHTLGWDWKLLAAQSYQESAFDPQATSWAGACGLMQLMPGTAAQVGVSMDKIYEPEDNVRGSVKYLKMLDNQFQDISNPVERINFMLAAYNCGSLHVRDAMALAQKYGKNPHIWKDNVEDYILHLQESKYNHDPVVKHGYCRGSETYNYVRQIMDRYMQYRRQVREK